jgi:hypothetical protein
MRRSVHPMLYLGLTAVLSLILLSPATLEVWQLSADRLTTIQLPASATPLAPVMTADLELDGETESVALMAGRAAITRAGQTLWESPAAWRVTQVAITDLNQDAQPEVALLVWRPFAPWPIDSYLPHPGRISGFHDSGGQSCHLILIGWHHQMYTELWAGSAMADPLTAFASADLDGDGREELAALESRYDASGPAQFVTVWEWNGFGFTLVARSPEGRYAGLMPLRDPSGVNRLLVSRYLRSVK